MLARTSQPANNRDPSHSQPQPPSHPAADSITWHQAPTVKQHGDVDIVGWSQSRPEALHTNANPCKQQQQQQQQPPITQYTPTTRQLQASAEQQASIMQQYPLSAASSGAMTLQALVSSSSHSLHTSFHSIAMIPPPFLLGCSHFI